MTFSKSSIGKLCLVSLSFTTALAAPATDLISEIETRGEIRDLTRRAGESESNPVDATFDISGWENIAEMNCYVMLCLKGGKRTYQRVESANGGNSHRTDSGATLTPFHEDKLQTCHTSQINQQTVSAEEFPWASTQQGGAGAFLMPATEDEQNHQKTGISAGYRRKGGPEYGQWFKITFTGAPLGKYCSALMNHDPPDTSVCGNNDQTTIWGVAGIILANFVYQVVKDQGIPYFFHHAAGSRKGTKRSVESEEYDGEELEGEKFHF